MERLYRILGQELVEDWVERGSLSDDFNPWYTQDISTYDTPEKRREIVESEYRAQLRRTGSTMIMLHPNYTLAFMEHEADEVEYVMATKIQSLVRGLLARNRFWSPYTEIGKKRLIKVFNSY
jgi:hypothetical protein